MRNNDSAAAGLFAGISAFLFWSGSSNLFNNNWQLNGLLLLAGLITLIPLLLFNIATRRLNLSTVGFLQYLAPTLHLLLATLAFGEPFGEGKMVTFGLVWLGLGLYSLDALAQRHSGTAAQRHSGTAAQVAAAEQSCRLSGSPCRSSRWLRQICLEQIGRRRRPKGERQGWRESAMVVNP
ncbi:EamA family transporter [Microbulbifer rhizosphaerae]|uniref:Drug/metabolite transporter (DMT)-like permease n=1 Tax=Microbulbifer rhizosphaerae TaxID=1562603 RepID=A0A7W4WFM6_9GAMM|nr:EamA family transporter [Microbulbifer rhizosphaerae]MBB3063333.1 drug/metabolite transporter (DMT)-like permease [Microbulbifer rhizosphaerae]